MHLLKWLRSVVKPKTVDLVPTGIAAALLDDLYSALPSFAIGAAGPVLVGAVAASYTGNPWFTYLTVVTATVASARAVLTIGYYRRKSSIVGVRAALRRWESWYAVGAIAQAGCFGGVCLVAFVFSNDPLCHLLVGMSAVGFTAGATARNSSRPQIAIAMVSVIALPTIVGFSLRGGLVYIVLSGLTIFYFLSSGELARYLCANRLRLLLATQSLAEQNVKFDSALSNMPHGLCMFDSRQRLMVWNKRFSEIYNIPPEALSPGLTVRQLIELSAASGNLPNQSMDDVTSENEARLKSGVSHSRRLLPDGRIVALSQQPMIGGGSGGDL